MNSSLLRLCTAIFLLTGCDAAIPNTSNTPSNSLFLLKCENKGVSFIDRQGNIVINDPRFVDAYNFSEGLAPVQIDTKWGFINKEGKIVIQPMFDLAVPFSDDLAQVMVEDQKEDFNWGFINQKGEMVIKPQFDAVAHDVSGFSDGLAWVGNGYIDKDGNPIKDLENKNTVTTFSQGLAVFEQEGKYGFIDKQGQIVIKPQFQDANVFSDDFAWVKVNDKWGLIDRQGKLIVPPQFNLVYSIGGDFSAARMSEEGKWGIIDKEGKTVIASQFDSVGSFDDGLVYVEKGNDKGYIDLDNEGKFLILTTDC